MNIVTATFSTGCSEIQADRNLWQYDQGQVLQLVGLDLPDAYQVEFSNSRDKGSAKAQIGGPDGVQIPDEYLTTGKPVYAFLVGHTAEEDRETEKLVVIYVNARSKPTDEPITPEQQSIVDQLIAALTAGVVKAEDAAAQAEEAIGYMPKIVDGTWWVYDAEAETWTDTGIQAEGQDGVGISGAVLNVDYTLTLTFTDGSSYTTPPIRGAQGERGPIGPTPDISIGTVTTGSAGSQAEATMTGTPEAPVLNLTIPRGDPGEVTQAEFDELADEVADQKSAIDYVTDSITEELVPYAANGDAAVGTSITLSQKGNRLLLNGRSTATTTQNSSKVLLSDHVEAWNAVTTPATAEVYSVKLVAGHRYAISADVISGTRDKTTGAGNLLVRLYNTSGQVFSATLTIDATHADGEYTSDGSPVAVRLLWGRLLSAENLLLEITIKDLTVTNLAEEQDSLVEATGNLEQAIGRHDGAPYARTTQTDYYWNAEGAVAVLTAISGWSAMTVDVTEGELVRTYIRGQSSTKQWPVLAVNNDFEILAHFGQQATTHQSLLFTVPEGVTKLLLTCYTSVDTSAQVYPQILNSVPDMIADLNAAGSYAGCKYSLLGDSFSAFDGYAPSGHAYYPSEQSDVETVDQMWWWQVGEALGMTPLVVNGWSGSCVAAGVRSSGYVPASDPSRCEALDDGTDTPDVVLVAMGLNDYTYTNTEAQYGTWDGTVPLGSAANLSDYNNTTFRTAYATMLARIQKKYPNAYIICITPFFSKRRTTDTRAVYLNAINKSIADYAEAVREICNIMNVACIDGTNIGFNRYNYYPTYAADLAGSSTHPTIAGQAQIAKAVISQLQSLHRLGA